MLRKEPRPDAQPIMQQFERAEIVDLPPKLRALFEDNKVTDSEHRTSEDILRCAAWVCCLGPACLSMITVPVDVWVRTPDASYCVPAGAQRRS